MTDVAKSLGEDRLYSWPCFSPDGSRIAVYRMDKDGQKADVFMTDVDGGEQRVVCSLGERGPVYLNWSPGGDRLGLMTQTEDGISLSTIPANEPGEETLLATGTPLFFTWTPDRVAAFVGGDPESRIFGFHPTMSAPHIVMPGRPGNFCVPLAVRRDLYYIDMVESASLVRASTVSLVKRTYDRIDGLVAMTLSPSRRLMARSGAPKGDQTPYRGLAVRAVRKGTWETIFPDDHLAFFWSPLEDALAVAQVDEDEGSLIWWRVGLDGSRVRIGAMRASSELAFYLRFFEQYEASHPIISPDGRYLLVGGSLLDRPDPGHVRVYALDLFGGAPLDLGRGAFGVFPSTRVPPL